MNSFKALLEKSSVVQQKINKELKKSYPDTVLSDDSVINMKKNEAYNVFEDDGEFYIGVTFFEIDANLNVINVELGGAPVKGPFVKEQDATKALKKL